MKPIAVYDGLNMKRLAYLQNAYDIKYHQYTNTLWTASFAMPYSDSKNDHCKPFNLVEIWDVDGGGSDRYVGLFRIMPRVEEPIGIDQNVQYTLEHVLATLLDDVMIGWHEVGNTGTYTGQVLSYIFSQQTQQRWLLETCDYMHEYLYGWQDENLLSALYSVVTPFSENDFYWSFNTQVYPWRISLKQTDQSARTDIRYRKNLAGIQRTEDPSNLTTRLYCYGYGDGDNKLTIRSVNNDIPYLESVNVSKYGVISQVWTDERITIEETLKTTGEAMLKELENPAVTYDIDVQTVREAGNLIIGDVVRVVHDRLDEYMIVRELSKDNVSGAPYSGKIVLGAGTNDLGNSISDISEKQRISETYSQGSESIFMDSFYDNADNTNPAETTFIVPENAVHVNEVRFSAKLTNFRAYSKATLGGGETTQSSTNGGATTQSSSSGGGGSVTSSGGGGGSATSSSGGGGYASSDDGGASTISSLDGGGYSNLSGSVTNGFQHRSGGYTGDGGAHAIDVDTSSAGHLDTSSASGTTISHTHVGAWHKHNVSVFVSSHNHSYGIPDHEHFVDLNLPNHSHTINIPNHSHWINLPNHYHNVYIPDHTHMVTIADHTHVVSIPSHNHNITLPNHTHAIEYGIYKGPIASQMSIYLDDVLIGTYTSSVSDLNLISYMSKNANGDVMRGSHTIKIVPSSLTRIECTFQIRLFTNARGSGQY